MVHLGCTCQAPSAALARGVASVKTEPFAAPARSSSPSPALASPAPRRNFILVIGDGMTAACEVAASRYWYGSDRALSFHQFSAQYAVTTWDVTTYNQYARARGKPWWKPEAFDPALGYDAHWAGCRPRPATPEARDYLLSPLSLGQRMGLGVPATDSASSATAMATGQKTDAGKLAWASGGASDGALEIGALVLRERFGRALGVVSTVPFSHATPAAFTAHNVSRNNYYTGPNGGALGIADEILERTRPEVVISGGHPAWDNPGFAPGKGFLSERLYRRLQVSGEYVLVERAPGQAAQPRLEQAARVAARGKKKLFGLFGGKGGHFDPTVPADRPGHPEALPKTRENPTLAEASTAALTVLETSPAGFFLLVDQGDIDWANHDGDFARMIAGMGDLDRAVRAMVEFIDRPGDALDWSNTTLVVTADHANGWIDFRRSLGFGDLPRQERSALGGGWRYPDGEISWVMTGHTNELVDLYTRGCGAELFRAHATLVPGEPIIDNTAVFAVTVQATGL
jgi:alkaline phosphatase